MRVIRFDDAACRRVARYLDAYLDGELTTETNIEVTRHVEGCRRCSSEVEGRLQARKALKRAVRGSGIPGDLEAKVRSAVQNSRGRRWRIARLAIAAALLMVLLGGSVAGWARFQQERRIDTLASRIAAIFHPGLGDHLHCALFRQSHPPFLQSFIERFFVDDLGPEYGELVPIMQRGMPHGFQVWMAHQCTYRGRRFVHLALESDQRLLSVVITRRQRSESFEQARLSPVVRRADVHIYETAAEEFSLAGFESSGHLVFFVSDLPEEQNTGVATGLAAEVAVHLNTVTS